MKTTLYKKGTKDKIQVWIIELDGGRYRTIEGFDNGVMTESKWTYVKQKYVGKKNETSYIQQAQLEVQAKILKKMEKGYASTKESAIEINQFQVTLAQEYSKREKNLSFSSTKYLFTQPKLDGMRCYINSQGMWSRENKPVVSCPHVLNAVKDILEKNPGLILDGELYNHDYKDDFNEIISIVRKAKPTPPDIEHSRLNIQYHIYDCYMEDSPELIFSDRFDSIKNLLSSTPYTVIVDTLKVDSKKSLDIAYNLYLTQGYEGQMIRFDIPYEQKRSSGLLKRKEFQDCEYEIVDVIEGVGNRSGMFGKFLLKTPEGKIFGSNARGNEEYYKEILLNKDKYIGKRATVRFQHLTPDGIPRFPVITSIRDYE